MSPTIITAIVTLLAFIIPLFGFEIGTEQLTEIVQSTATVVLAVVAYFERRTLQKAPLGRGDVTAFGKVVS